MSTVQFTQYEAFRCYGWMVFKLKCSDNTWKKLDSECYSNNPVPHGLLSVSQWPSGYASGVWWSSVRYLPDPSRTVYLWMPRLKGQSRHEGTAICLAAPPAS